MKKNSLFPKRPQRSLRHENVAKDWYTTLNPAQKASIERGLADADAGRTVTSEEMWKRFGRTKNG
jgi:predicted transcriptional regulator